MNQLTFCLIDTLGLLYTGDTVYKRGLGGSESAAIYMGEELTKQGFLVTVYCHCEQEGIYNGVQYLDLSKIREEKRAFDILISTRSVLPLVPQIHGPEVWNKFNVDIGPYSDIVNNAKFKAVWMHDTFLQGEEYLEPLLVDGYINEVFLLSDWHSFYVSQSDHWGTPKRRFEQMKNHIFETRNGIRRHVEEVDITKKDPNLYVYNSSITKGMVPLVTILWPKIIKEFPNAKLTVIGGYYNFAGKGGTPDQGEIDFHKLRAEWDGKLNIHFTGVITQKEIGEILTKATYMIYPPEFPETFGISTLEAINYNCLPITSRFGALEEVAAESVSYLTDYEFRKDNMQPERMLRKVIEANRNPYLRQQKQYACNEIKPWSTWDTVAVQWKMHFYRFFNIIPARAEIEQARIISNNWNRFFKRRNTNQEEKFEFFSATTEKEIFIVSPVYNAEQYISNCIRSVAAQIYDNYLHVIIDDMSTDNTVAIAQATIQGLEPRLRDKFLLIKNTEKGCAVANQVKIIDNIESEEAIVILLDGDDWLSNSPDIFRFINDVYLDGTEFTYGSCHSLADNIDLIAQPYPEKIKQTKTYRSHLFNWGMPYTHLRTFKKGLYNKISIDSLKDENGNWYGPGGDGALFYSLIEQANPQNVKCIQRILVQYNDINSLNDYKVNGELQTTNQKKILNKGGQKLGLQTKEEIIQEEKEEVNLGHKFLKREKIIENLFDIYPNVMHRDLEALEGYKYILENRDDSWIDNLNDSRIKIRTEWLKKQLHEKGISKEAKILDIGSWSGGFANQFYELGWKNITCLDISKANIDTGKRTFPGLKWIQGDVEKIKLTEKYDMILLFEILEHLVDPIAVIEKAKDALNPGGSIFITIPTEDTVFVGPEHISCLTENDLRVQADTLDILKSDDFNWYAARIYKPKPVLESIENIPKRILIGMPTAKYIESDTFMSIYRLKKPDGAQIDFQCFYGYNIAQIRNLMADWIVKGPYDYMFWVDSDIVLPEDTLIKLLNTNQDIVSGCYIQRKDNEKIPEVYLDNNQGGTRNATIEEITDKGIIEVKGCGFGCVLTSKRVLVDVGYPQFEYFNALDHKNTISEDSDFCRKAERAGYKIYVDTSIKCDHIGSTRFKI